MAEHSGPGDGYRVLSMLIAGPLFYGGAGWLLDQWLQTSWIFPVGIVVGAAAGVYMVIARYGRTS
ncbi:MAG: AtpZ/AtpI family protein [Propionibacteriaceae bacterium]|jgi:F0F1-type ATP synthase assembly protein I|nr:AtpZ/AtpI family protein [Propionibacteriaceae bacterium]